MDYQIYNNYTVFRFGRDWFIANTTLDNGAKFNVNESNLLTGRSFFSKWDAYEYIDNL